MATEQNDRSGIRAWYVIHTYSGYENKVKANLERKIASQGLEDVIFNVVVPVEDEAEEKDGKTKIVQRKVFPGYVLVDMIVNNHSWYVVRNTQGVTGFVGSEKDPIPLSDEEARRILQSGGGAPKKRSSGFAVGDMVRITSGWFEDQVAKVAEVNEEDSRLKVLMGETSVDVAFDQVEKA